jgi:citrate synthase
VLVLRLAPSLPGLRNTALCKSKIASVETGPDTLRYRGYAIEELAAHSTYLETAYLIVKGELPVASHFATWERNIKMHTMLHENVKRLMEGFRYDARPMSILTGTVAASRLLPRRHDVLDLIAARQAARSMARCRPSRPSRRGAAAASPTSTRTTTSPTPATSSPCSSR